VAERAGRSLKKVVMELGGSDPLIVLSDADLGVAVEGALFGRELSDLGFGEFVNRKLVNVAPAGAPPWGPVPA